MLKNTRNVMPLLHHRAFYRVVSKQRWSVFQKREMEFWKQPEALRTRQVFCKRYYLPILQSVSRALLDPNILEIGCGPVCIIQHIQGDKHTYVDPLLDYYRRQFPNVMPEDAAYKTNMAEKAVLPEVSFDLVACLNTLSDVHNPELLLNKVEAVLKDDGVFVVSIDIWPPWLARAHLFLSRLAPTLPRFNRLYSYTYRGFSNTLKRHFEIVDEQCLQSRLPWLFFKKEYIFTCKHKHD